MQGVKFFLKFFLFLCQRFWICHRRSVYRWQNAAQAKPYGLTAVRLWLFLRRF